LLQYTIIGNEDGESNIVVFVSGSAPQVASQSHPNYDRIVAGALAGDDSIIELFDIAATAAQKFSRLSDRVTTANGRLYLDGVEVDNALSAQVLRFMDEGVEDWKPLVAFFENVQANPNEHSREQLFEWLSRRDFTITADGMIVGYKGVASAPDGGYLSISAGKAIVDGEVVTGRIPTNPGSIVEMPRDEVEWDPSVGCHTGLHVGTFEYASGFARGTVLEVHVNPRDVVSVPTDSDAAKVRCCRYHIVREIEVPYTEAVVYDDFDEDYLDDEFPNRDWGDGEGECDVPTPLEASYARYGNGPALGLQC
jgi:hypothetical protein